MLLLVYSLSGCRDGVCRLFVRQEWLHGRGFRFVLEGEVISFSFHIYLHHVGDMELGVLCQVRATVCR